MLEATPVAMTAVRCVQMGRALPTPGCLGALKRQLRGAESRWRGSSRH